MRSVRHIQPEDIGPGIQQLANGFHRVSGRTECSQNTGLTISIHKLEVKGKGADGARLFP